MSSLRMAHAAPKADIGPRKRAAGLQALADELLSAMAAIRRSARRQAGRPVELSALTGSQLDLIQLVRRRPNVSVTQAAEELHVAPNTVSTLVRQLTDARLLIRKADTTDRRVARLDLTQEMRRKVGAFRDRRIAILIAGMQEMSPADQRRLRGAVDVLMTLSRQLQRQGSSDD